jgi:two-component system KDP operon response regulator KdpE
MTTTHTILVVDDEEQLLRMLQSALVHEGYEVITAKSGGEALTLLARQEVSLILLDLGLPDVDGKEVITASRALSAAPVLVVSARGSEREKISALDLGANDYVGKPFDMGELFARIRVALRPSHAARPPPPRAAELTIDCDTRRATVDGRAVRLSRKEAELVRILIEADGAVVSHTNIIEQIWGGAAESDQMNLRVLAWQVRRKIEPNPTVPRYLIAEAGEGYRLKLD